MSEPRSRMIRAGWLALLGGFCVVVGWIQADTTVQRVLTTIIGIVFIGLAAAMLRTSRADAWFTVLFPAMAVIVAIILWLM
jgi:hypothetical protein